MDAEHKRPLAAFVVVTVASALLLGQSLSSQSPPDDDPPAASQTSGKSTTSSPPSSSPASGQAVDGVTSTPVTGRTVKSIGRAPMLYARGDDDLGVSVGAVKDPDSRQTDPVRTRDGDESSGPKEHPGPPDPKPSGGPTTDPDDDGSPGNSGGHSQVPTGPPGPRDNGVLPTPHSHRPQ